MKAAEGIEADVARMPLSGAAVTALARAYVHWERGAYPPTIRSLQMAAQRDDEDSGRAVAAVTELLDGGFLKPGGEGEGDRREVEIAPPGIRWFEVNCDYWRECNVYRFHSRFGVAGCFEFDPRRTLGRRLLDPLVPGAALAGGALAALTMWLVR
ncbi:MAG: hypothetical protein JOZ90_02315 [Alphaproteobacteria bacterium]|nr:hypothetical protein [Alphaproteobacteria bacterium]MBV9371182.1 hypothetical protein [Alphaproteobacteria bacterium]MBV9899912.1 hypothetical protein [Alphaproteobacteria bacterium]